MGGRHVAYLYLLSGRADVFVLYGTVDRSRALRKKNPQCAFDARSDSEQPRPSEVSRPSLKLMVYVM